MSHMCLDPGAQCHMGAQSTRRPPFQRSTPAPPESSHTLSQVHLARPHRGGRLERGGQPCGHLGRVAVH